MTTGKTEEKIQTGGTAFSKKEWEKLIGRVDKVEDKAKEDIEEKKKQEVDKSLNERNAAYEKMSVKASVTKEKTVKNKQDVLELLWMIHWNKSDISWIKGKRKKELPL